MKQKTKAFISVIAVLLSCVLLSLILFTKNNSKNISGAASTRTIALTQSTLDAQSILNEFDEATLTKNGTTTYFEGYKSLDKNLFSQIDYISDTDIEDLNITAVKYCFSYDEETNLVTIQASMRNEENRLEIEQISGVAFINEDGEIDAVMNVDGENILLSEMRDAGLIENCGWFKRLIKSIVKVVAVTVVAVAVAAVVVGTAGTAAVAVVATVGVTACAASTTQTVKANTNYSHNKKQSLHGDVDSKGYITDQSYYGDWQFGFAYLNDVGCEVIATYNAMIKLGKKKSLADVIYDFEMYNIDFDIGFGHLGSNPRQIYRYLNKYGVRYTAYDSFNKLKSAADSMSDCTIIFTSKTNKSVAGIHAIHTFMIEKNKSGIYKSYNGYIDSGVYDLSLAIRYQFDYAYIVS